MSWTEAKIQDVCEFVRNGKSIKQDRDAGGLPITRIETIADATIDAQRVGYANVSETDYPDYLMQDGDILFSHINSVKYVGKCAIYEGKPEKLLHGMNLLCLRPKKEVLHPKFFLYALRTKAFRVQVLAYTNKAVNQASISGTNLKRLRIPLPPLAEQKRIAEILDQADELRQKRRKALARLDDLLQSVFLEMFGEPGNNTKGWKSCKMKDVVLSFQNGTGKNKEYYGTGTKVANIGDLYEWHTFKPEKYSLLQVTDKEIDKYKLSRGDLLFVRSSVKREGVAFCSMYDSDETCLFSSFMIRVKVDKKKIFPEFLAFLLRTDPMRKQLINAANTGTITNISQYGLASIKFIVPPLDLQETFLNVVSSIEIRYGKMEQQVKKLDTLFSSLQQRAFRGEL